MDVISSMEGDFDVTLQEDLEYDQMSIKEYIDPFTGEPVNKNKKK